VLLSFRTEPSLQNVELQGGGERQQGGDRSRVFQKSFSRYYFWNQVLLLGCLRNPTDIAKIVSCDIWKCRTTKKLFNLSVKIVLYNTICWIV
jgi:hypothetical protein